MRATEKKRIDGDWVEVPVMRLKPKDLAVLIDRFQMKFNRPTRICEQHDLRVSSGIPLDALDQLVDLTREREGPPSHASLLPRGHRRFPTPGGRSPSQGTSPGLMSGARHVSGLRVYLDPRSGRAV
jgi:hypothetical protein